MSDFMPSINPHGDTLPESARAPYDIIASTATYSFMFFARDGEVTMSAYKGGKWSAFDPWVYRGQKLYPVRFNVLPTVPYPLYLEVDIVEGRASAVVCRAICSVPTDRPVFNGWTQLKVYLYE
jgi:hypothetical protein